MATEFFAEGGNNVAITLTPGDSGILKVIAGGEVIFDKDIEGYGCGIDIIDGALETLDMTLFKRGMLELSSDVVADVGRREIVEMDLFFDFFRFQKKTMP